MLQLHSNLAKYEGSNQNDANRAINGAHLSFNVVSFETLVSPKL